MPTPDPAAFAADLEDALTQLDAGDFGLDEAREQIQQAHDRHVKAVAAAGYALTRPAAIPTGRYVDPHPGASNAPDGIESGTAPSLTVRFDRAGFQMSVATAEGETTDLSRLADLAEAAIHIEES